jgi:hypothetical protein
MATSTHQANSPLYQYGFSDGETPIDDETLVVRLGEAYRNSEHEFGGFGASFWASFADRHTAFINAIRSGDDASLAELLRSPSQSELFWGFDDLAEPFVRLRRENEAYAATEAAVLHERLTQLAIAVGALRCPNPEAGQELPRISTDELVAAIESKFGFEVHFPNPFRYEFGLITTRGIAGYRAIQALYQSWRTAEVAKVVGGAKILEIGGGLGRNVYFAKQFDLTDYTIVDIPSTQLAQGYFLGRVLGEKEVSLVGEPSAPLKLRSPAWLHRDRGELFDVMINVDSLTEMDRDHALAYLEVAMHRCRGFLSINHEFNPETVSGLLREIGSTPVSRGPYWPRPGYVEELVVNRIKQLETENEKVRNRVKLLETEIDATTSDLNIIRASRSWRLTAPLRRLRSALWIGK